MHELNGFIRVGPLYYAWNRRDARKLQIVERPRCSSFNGDACPDDHAVGSY